MQIFSQIGQAEQYDPAVGGIAPLTPLGGKTFFVEKTNVRFEFSTLKLVYRQIFSQIRQAEQYDPRGGRCPFDPPQGGKTFILKK